MNLPSAFSVLFLLKAPYCAVEGSLDLVKVKTLLKSLRLCICLDEDEKHLPRINELFVSLVISWKEIKQ